MANLLKIVSNAYVTRKQPISLVHFITNRCNARCKHCFIDFDAPGAFAGELKFEEIEKLTKQFDNSLLNVNITGGEPFLRSDIYRIVEAYFLHAGVSSVYITTHGGFTDRTAKFIDQFIEADIDGQIIFSFSIDNFEKAHNENRRLRNLFQSTLDTFHMVHDHDMPNIIPNIAITVTQHNYDQVINLYRYLKEEEGVDAFTAIAMREQGVIKNMDPTIKTRIHEAYIELTNQISEDQKSRETVGYKGTLVGRVLNAKNKIQYDILQNTYLEPRYISHCPAGALFVVVYANGDVYPCEILHNRKLGNLRKYEMNLLELLQNAETNACKKFIKDTDCHCSYECAWSINIISNKQYIPSLVSGVAKTYFR